MVIYINNEHCSSLEQLKGYFTQASPNNDIYWDLLDYGRSGDISKWLYEIGENKIADRLDTIDPGLTDTQYFTEMTSVILGENVTPIDKPDFSQVFNVEEVKQEVFDSYAKVRVVFNVIMSVNEEYEVKLQTDWGTKAININSNNIHEGKSFIEAFEFRKRPGKAFGQIKVYVDGDIISEVQGTNNHDSDSILNITVEGSRFSMMAIKGGTFMMGATSEQGNDSSEHERPVHTVEIRDFYLCKTLVTQKLWTSIMGYNHSQFKGDLRPITNVTYSECLTFIKNLSKRTGKKFRLPTEEEWEYAARDGSLNKKFKYSGGNQIDEIAWYGGNASNVTHDVATKKANRLGLFDMSGNVWEWCGDNYSSYDSSDIQSKTDTLHQNDYVCRGGSWGSGEWRCRVSTRKYRNADHVSKHLGFRIVLDS